tara:strand:- start:57 stop:647 length:591 start_codon:yes stop_codon:yes gene_type:complete
MIPALIAKGGAKAATVAGKVGGKAAEKTARDVATRAVMTARSPQMKQALMEAGIQGLGTTLATGDLGKGVQAAGLNTVGNFGLGMGLDALSANKNIDPRVRNAANNEYVRLAGQLGIGALANSAVSNRSVASQTVSPDQQAALMAGQASIMTAATNQYDAEQQARANILNQGNQAFSTAADLLRSTPQYVMPQFNV